MLDLPTRHRACVTSHDEARPLMRFPSPTTSFLTAVSGQLMWTKRRTCMKTDEYIKHVVVAAIRRKSIDLGTWVGTQLWDQGDPELKIRLSLACDLDAGEHSILYSYIDLATWTLVTTRRIWCSIDGCVSSVAASEVIEYRRGHFKDCGHHRSFDRAELRCRNGGTLHCPYETGNPSMGTIYAIVTLCRVTPTK